MKLTMIGCDNPSCPEIGEPEGEGVPPYGWIRCHGEITGPGPGFQVEVCSTECVGGAIDRAIEMHHHGEQEEIDRYYRRLQHAIRNIPCPTCPAEAEEQCVSKYGNLSQRPHAAREDRAQEMMREADAASD